MLSNQALFHLYLLYNSSFMIQHIFHTKNMLVSNAEKLFCSLWNCNYLFNIYINQLNLLSFQYASSNSNSY